MSIKNKQSTMIVYRVEHETDRTGPFHKASSVWRRTGHGLNSEKHKEYTKMPCPDTDKLYDFGDDCVFAFPTLQAYVSFWGKSTLEDLRALGYVLREYVVLTRYCQVGMSGWQVVYPQNRAREVKTYDLLEVIE